MASSRSATLIASAALVLSAIVFGMFYYSAQSANTKDVLSVTGSAKQRITSDQAKLIVSITRTVPLGALAGGYASVARDLGLTRDLLRREGIPDAAVTETPVSANQQYSNDQFAEPQYQLNQTVTVQSDDVAKMTDLSRKVPSLAGQGAIVSIQALEYYYSKLPDLRVSLLGDAVQDAQARAAKIAESTGRRVGGVQAASTGVVQVLPVNSVDVSDYGTYDTSSIEKDVMVTIKASFGVR